MRERFATGRQRPPGEWVGFSTILDVVGIQHRRADAEAFAGAAQKAEAKRLEYGIGLQWEPDNPHDPNAIAVIGIAQSKRWLSPVQTSEWKVGYLPREVSAEIVARLIQLGLPVGAVLHEIKTNDDGGYLDIRVVVLGPKGQGRKVKAAGRPTA